MVFLASTPVNGPLLALAKTPPNYDALALAPTIGWLLLACAICVALMFIAHAEKWRAWWLSKEDPRGIAVFRVVFVFLAICNINGMWEVMTYVYTDEGLFTTDVARHLFAREQFAGYGDGLRPDDPRGFYDWAAVWQFVRGPRYSLLFFWDSPRFFWAHLVAFEISAVLFMVGYRTRLFGVLTWALMNSLLVRNYLPWEGTDSVFRCMMFYLILARSGEAYSVDNWLRTRRLRKRGRLSERDGPGGGAGLAPCDAHPEGLEPIYRLIPSWPRKLIMLQLAVLYLTTGALKTGEVWMAGDALYYAINLDQFYRLPSQYLAYLAGTNAFRLMTWSVKIGQCCFSLVIFSLVARWVIKQNFPPASAIRQLAGRLAFAGLIAGSAAIIYVAYPVHVTPAISRAAFTGGWLSLWIGLWLVWLELGRAPFVIRKIAGRELERPATIDRTWVCRWVLGRRVFLVWHLAFHAHIMTLMNVGQFQTVMMACAFAYLEGPEIATMLRDMGHFLARVVPGLGKRLPRSVVEQMPILPAADPRLPDPHRDTAGLPDWALLLGLAGVVGGILVRVWIEPEWDFRLVWVASAAVLGGVAFVSARAARTRDDKTPPPTTRAAWAYGPMGRLLIGGLLIWHMGAVAAWLLPTKDCTRSFRRPARDAVSHYLYTTNTTQSWGMFAPNPPRANSFLKVLVTDADGKAWDLRTDVYAPEEKPIPWIWNKRQRKMNRRILFDKSKHYREWHARYHCRQWAREHGGEAPAEVAIIKVSYRIPPPEQVREEGYYIAEERLESHGRETTLYTARCARELMGQLPNFIRARDGLPLLDEGEYRPWHKNKRRRWEQRDEAKARSATSVKTRR